MYAESNSQYFQVLIYGWSTKGKAAQSVKFLLDLHVVMLNEFLILYAAVILEFGMHSIS